MLSVITCSAAKEKHNQESMAVDDPPICDEVKFPSGNSMSFCTDAREDA
jgi:hypothetical protein